MGYTLHTEKDKIINKYSGLCAMRQTIFRSIVGHITGCSLMNGVTFAMQMEVNAYKFWPSKAGGHPVYNVLRRVDVLEQSIINISLGFIYIVDLVCR